MIDKEKAINLLNNMSKEQENYLYGSQVPSDLGFYLKALGCSYCILVYKDFEKDIIEDIIFRDKEDLKKLLDDNYHPYFKVITKELADRMIKDFPSLSFYDAHDGLVHLIHRGVVIANVAR